MGSDHPVGNERGVCERGPVEAERRHIAAGLSGGGQLRQDPAQGRRELEAVGRAQPDPDRLVTRHGVDYRQNNVRAMGQWQLFIRDPNGIVIELQFIVANEPAGSKGPDATKPYMFGTF